MKLRTAIKILMVSFGAAGIVVGIFVLLSSIIEPALALIAVLFGGGIAFFISSCVDDINDNISYLLFGSEYWYPKPMSEKELKDFANRRIIYPK